MRRNTNRCDTTVALGNSHSGYLRLPCKRSCDDFGATKGSIRVATSGFGLDFGKKGADNPCTYPEISSAGTDVVYRTCYRACAGGPFQQPVRSGKVTRRLSGAPQHSLEVWDNDGIVHTMSMIWPKRDNVLVVGDHMDIVGQYKQIEADRGGGRKYRAYDLLKSDSGFGDKIFKEVWNEIFAFWCGGGRAA